MGLKNLEKIRVTHETPPEILELVRMSILETLQPDFYHSADEHSKAAIELHKEVATKYPNFYLDVYSDTKFTDFFLDAHKSISMPYLLQDEKNVDTVLENLLDIQPNRIGDAYSICKMEDLFGVKVSNETLRKIFEFQTKHIENSKGRNYVGYMGVKYAMDLHNIMASIRVKKKKLTPVWQEVMKWTFERDENFKYSTNVLKEVAKLKKIVTKGTKPRIALKDVPFTVWQGYAKAIGYSEEEIFKKYELMTNNEVRRNLNTLQKYGILDTAYHKKKIKDKVMRTETDLMQLFYAIKVLDRSAKKILMEKGKTEYETQVEETKKMLDEKKISVAVDCSGGCAGHTNLLNPEMQRKIVAGDHVPNWAKIIQRESFNANILIGKVLAEAAEHSVVYLFNETAQETELPEKFKDLVDALKKVECSGGSNVLAAVQKAVADDPDIAFIITDMNENVPFQGALKSQLEDIAKKFKGLIIFVITETIVERNEATLLDELIRDKKLFNVFQIAVKKLNQLNKGFKLIELLEEAKKVFKKSKNKKRKVIVNES